MSTVPDAFITAATTDHAGATTDQAPYRFTAETFCKMITADVFVAEDRVELWDGQITTKMAKNVPHSFTSARLTYTLSRTLTPGWCLWPENPVNLGTVRVPLPDFAVLRGELQTYADRYPVAADVGLIVELADSSLHHDTTTKLAGYAEAGIPVYWVVNLVANTILVFERPIPAEQRYETTQTYSVGQSVPLRLDGVLIAEIPAVDLLPVRG